MTIEERIEKTLDIIRYLRKKPNGLIDDTMRETLDRLPDAEFLKAVNRLLLEPVKFSMDIDRFSQIIREVSAPEVSHPWIVATEIKCDCCGHNYLWSVVGADKEISAANNWWYSCPHCGFDGYIQQDTHRYIERTGKCPAGYRAMLDRQWEAWARHGFEPRVSQNQLKEELAKKAQINRKEWEEVQRLLMELEQSHVERRRRSSESRILQFPAQTVGAN